MTETTLRAAIEAEEKHLMDFMAAPIDNYGVAVVKRRQAILDAAKRWQRLTEGLPEFVFAPKSHYEVDEAAHVVLAAFREAMEE